MSRIIFIILVLSISSVYAGESGYRFLRVGVPAKAAGLGEAYVSRLGDVNTYMYNPAGLSQLTHRQMAAGYMDHILDISSGYGVYAQPYKDKGVFGAGFVYFGYGSFKGYDAAGYETGSYSSGDFALSFFYARPLQDNLHVGAAIKFIRSSIESYSSSALALDLGAIYVLSRYDMQLGVSLLNAGIVTKKFIDYNEKLPLSLQLGVSKQWRFYTFGLDWSDLNVPGNRFSRFILSAEADPWEKIIFRAGYNHQRRNELDLNGSGFLDHAAGLSVGFGFKYQNYVFDYAFASWGIGAVNRFSLTVNW